MYVSTGTIYIGTGTISGTLNGDININNTCYITSSEKLGIGTTSPNAPLQFATSLSSRKIVLWEGANDNNQFLGFGVDSATLRYQINTFTDSHVFYCGSGASSSRELMRVKGDGTMLIGGNTTSSTGSMLTISKNLSNAASTSIRGSYYLRLGDQEYRTGSYRLMGLGYIGNNGYQPAYIGYYEDLQTNQSYGSIVFGTRITTTDTEPIERMRISPTGTVGIGVTNPIEMLDVATNEGRLQLRHWRGYSYPGNKMFASYRIRWFNQYWDIGADRGISTDIESLRILRNDTEFVRMIQPEM